MTHPCGVFQCPHVLCGRNLLEAVQKLFLVVQASPAKSTQCPNPGGGVNIPLTFKKEFPHTGKFLLGWSLFEGFLKWFPSGPSSQSTQAHQSYEPPSSQPTEGTSAAYAPFWAPAGRAGKRKLRCCCVYSSPHAIRRATYLFLDLGMVAWSEEI